MRTLAGTEWGAQYSILKTVYQKGTVRPHLEYAAKSHHKSLDRVQNQALLIITGSLRSTPIKTMQETGDILIKRRDAKILTQSLKHKTLTEHPMKEKLSELSCHRLKHTSFVKIDKSLKRQNLDKLPETIKPQKEENNPP